MCELKAYKTSQRYTSSGAGKLGRDAVCGFFNGVSAVSQGLSILTRTVTSPLNSVKAAWKQEGWIKYPSVFVSMVCSVAGLGALAVVAAPFLVAQIPGVVAALAPAGSWIPAAITTGLSSVLPGVSVSASASGLLLSAITGAAVVFNEIRAGVISIWHHLS